MNKLLSINAFSVITQDEIATRVPLSLMVFSKNNLSANCYGITSCYCHADKKNQIGKQFLGNDLWLMISKVNI